MGRKGHVRLRPLAPELARTHPHIEDPERLILAGQVLVDGWPVRNPASLVRAGASIVIRRPKTPRGSAKLSAALSMFAVAVQGRVALDLGAAAGGFTRVLLDAGAGRVYAVDAGYGQLAGSLRQHPRVVNLERTNLGSLEVACVPETIGVITIDLSYLSVARAVTQLAPLRIAGDADLIALVKPTFELGLGTMPVVPETLGSAVRHAQRGLEAAGWRVAGAGRSPVPGGRGAIEFLVHGRRG